LGVCIEATLQQASRAEHTRTMEARPTVIRCILCSLNTLAMLISTTLPTPRQFRCDDSRLRPCLAVPGATRLLDGWREVFLYFCRDPTLWLFYHLFIIFAQLYISPPRKPPPVNRLPHPRHPLPVYENTPILGHPSRLAFLGSCILLRDHRSPDAPTLIMSLPPRDSFLSCFLVGSLFSLISFSSLGHLSIACGAYQGVGPRVRGVGRSPCLALSSPSLFDSRSRCFPLDMFGLHTRGPILPYRSFLC